MMPEKKEIIPDFRLDSHLILLIKYQVDKPYR